MPAQWVFPLPRFLPPSPHLHPLISQPHSPNPPRLPHAPHADTIDLAKALPQHFVNGTVHCPLPTMCLSLDTCGRCDKGRCWKGKCYCHLEAVGEWGVWGE